jgi:hypothetical protein
MMAKFVEALSSGFSSKNSSQQAAKSVGGFICFFAIMQFLYIAYALFKEEKKCSIQVIIAMTTILFFMSILQVMEAKKDPNNKPAAAIATMAFACIDLIATAVISFYHFKE